MNLSMVLILMLLFLGVGYKLGNADGKEKGANTIIKVPISNCKEGHMK